MPAPAPPVTPALTIENLSEVLRFPVRWRILQMLGKGEPLPTIAIARRLGLKPVTASKHLNLMRRNGALAQGYGRLYSIAPAFRPAPGTNVLDFGPCLVRVEAPAP